MSATREQAEKHFIKCVRAMHKTSLSHDAFCEVNKCMMNFENWWNHGLDCYGDSYTHDDLIENLNGLMEEFGIEVTND